jgi:hypothetical protein
MRVESLFGLDVFSIDVDVLSAHEVFDSGTEAI